MESNILSSVNDVFNIFQLYTMTTHFSGAMLCKIVQSALLFGCLAWDPDQVDPIAISTINAAPCWTIWAQSGAAEAEEGAEAQSSVNFHCFYNSGLLFALMILMCT